MSSTREHQGTGLGLAVAKTIIEAHGGQDYLEIQAWERQYVHFCHCLFALIYNALDFSNNIRFTNMIVRMRIIPFEEKRHACT